MSLIGIDVGTSTLKAAIYNQDGKTLAATAVPVTAIRPEPTWWELDPNHMWRAFTKCIALVTGCRQVKKDPPQALAVAASGEEAFLVDKHHQPLGNCIMSGDARGHEIERSTEKLFSRKSWYNKCGHVPDRMDPVNRLLWLRKYHPQEFARAALFLNWHDYISLKLCDRPVTDTTLASKWLIYDLAAARWSAGLMNAFDISPSLLPAIQPPGTPIDRITPSMARQLGLPPDLIICTGGFDSCCAALGTGASRSGTLSLACGTWEVVTAPVHDTSIIPRLVEKNFPLVAYPGEAGFAVKAQSPNGSSVANWAGRFFNEPFLQLEKNLRVSGRGPGHALAIPHLSGALCPWINGRDFKGSLLGITHSIKNMDAVKAFMEGVAFDLSLTLSFFKSIGRPADLIRAAGGGTRSPWWMQLKADLCAAPIEVIAQNEPGTFGAALLAGAAIGAYKSAGQAARQMTRIKKRYRPDQRRAALYQERIEVYRTAVVALAEINKKIY